MSLHEQEDEGYHSCDEKEEEEAVEEREGWMEEELSEESESGLMEEELSEESESIDVRSIICNPTLARSISFLARIIVSD